eukprot:425710-Hanusia_phi.AAC.1
MEGEAAGHGDDGEDGLDKVKAEQASGLVDLVLSLCGAVRRDGRKGGRREQEKLRGGEGGEGGC